MTSLRDKLKVFYRERRPYLVFYARRSLEDATLSGLAGFLASLAAGLGTGYTLRFSLILAALTGAVSFLRELKRGRVYDERQKETGSNS